MSTTRYAVVDSADTAELIEILEFLCEWFDRDHNNLDHSLQRFSPGGVDLGEFKTDLHRLTEQLGQAPLITTPDHEEARP